MASIGEQCISEPGHLPIFASDRPKTPPREHVLTRVPDRFSIPQSGEMVFKGLSANHLR